MHDREGSKASVNRDLFIIYIEFKQWDKLSSSFEKKPAVLNTSKICTE